MENNLVNQQQDKGLEQYKQEAVQQQQQQQKQIDNFHNFSKRKEKKKQRKQERLEGDRKTCLFYLKKKQRYCHFDPSEGSMFCNVHKDNDKLIPCPIDPSHSISEAHLQQHVKKCDKLHQKQKIKKEIWYNEKVNISALVQENQEKEDLSQQSIQNKMDYNNSKLNVLFQQKCEKLNGILEQIPMFFKKAVKIYMEHLEEQNQNKFESQEKLEQYLLDIGPNQQIQQQNNNNNEQQQQQDQKEINKEDINHTQKHLQQGKKLISVLDDNFLIQKQYCFIEFGAGKGLLSSQIADSIKDKFEFNQSCHILLEREGRVKKYDRFHRENKVWSRLVTDIVHFDINKVTEFVDQKGFEQYYEKPLNVVGISKHMCGMATDLSINTLLNIKDNNKQYFKGLMIATCCHQLCEKSTYTNVDFLKELGVQYDLIDVFFHVSSWYVSIPKKENLREVLLEKYQGLEEQLQQYQEQGKKFIDYIGDEEKLLLGKMVKRVTDIGRVMNLRVRLQANAQLRKYCEDDFSLENFVIIMK